MTDQTQEEKLGWSEALADQAYHQRQFNHVYRSTEMFCDWLESLGLLNEKEENKVIDIGAGQGANLLYMSKRFPSGHFRGVEINADFVRKGNEYFSEVGQNNCHLDQGDLYHLNNEYVGKNNGVISFQTLSWLPECVVPIEKMAELNSQWIAISSLFFGGHSNCQILVKEHEKSFRDQPHKEFYTNVYSIPLVQDLFSEMGYVNFKCTPFEIDIDLPKPETKEFSTYTQRVESGRRLQISGPLLMPWYFIVVWK